MVRAADSAYYGVVPLRGINILPSKGMVKRTARSYPFYFPKGCQNDMNENTFHAAAIDRIHADYLRHYRALRTIHPVYKSLYINDIVDDMFQRMEALRLIMAGKKTTRKTGTGYGDWKGFSNVPLTADAKRSFDLWVGEVEDLNGMIAEMQQAGYRFTGAYNAKNQAYSCSVTSTAEGRPDFGYTMTSLAPDPITAQWVACFKHFVLCEEVWPLDETSKGGSQWG